jgi:hypothetical protein
LTSDIHRHNKYFPCCKVYEEGGELTPQQMGDFLEYCRVLHNMRQSKNSLKSREEGDISSEFSDLSEEGALQASLAKISSKDMHSLKRYVNDLRKLQQLNPKKHECGTRQKANNRKRIDNKR